MRHLRLPEAFTLIGTDEEGKEYIQCTRTGDVLVQTGPEEWAHFASAREWRSKRSWCIAATRSRNALARL